MPTINSVNNFARTQQLNGTKMPVAFRETPAESTGYYTEEPTGMKTSTKVAIGAGLLALGTLAAVYFKSPKAASAIKETTTATLEKGKNILDKAKTVVTETIIPKAKALWTTASDKAKGAWDTTVNYFKSFRNKV